MSRGTGRGRGAGDPLAAWRRRVAAVRAEAERELAARGVLELVCGVELDSSGQLGAGAVVLRVQLRGRAPLVFAQRAAGEPVTVAEQGGAGGQEGPQEGGRR